MVERGARLEGRDAMTCVASSEAHCLLNADGVWTDSLFTYAHWAPWLEHVSDMAVVARVRRMVADDAVPAGWQRVDGPGVRVICARPFRGTEGAWGGIPSLMAAAWRAAGMAQVGVLRSPGVVSSVLHLALRARGVPWGIEVVGDPAESLAHAEPVLRRSAWAFAWAMRQEVRGARASLFVTTHALQRLYPPANGAPTAVMPNVHLPDELFAAGDAHHVSSRQVLHVVFVGTLSQPYKGLDVLLRALSLTACPHTLTVVGDGRLRPDAERLSAELGLQQRVAFLGAIARDDVWNTLQASDLFVLPTRSEGLPRALLEAMAAGLPCLATPVGGIPEILPPAALVSVDSPSDLAHAIDRLALDPALRVRLGRANRERVRPFRASEAQRARNEFRRAVAAAMLPTSREPDPTRPRIAERMPRR